MSVAFRRDSDEEHLEPKFAVPIPPGRNLVTAHGISLIDARVTVLEQAVAGRTINAAQLFALVKEHGMARTRIVIAERQMLARR